MARWLKSSLISECVNKILTACRLAPPVLSHWLMGREASSNMYECLRKSVCRFLVDEAHSCVNPQPAWVSVFVSLLENTLIRLSLQYVHTNEMIRHFVSTEQDMCNASVCPCCLIWRPYCKCVCGEKDMMIVHSFWLTNSSEHTNFTSVWHFQDRSSFIFTTWTGFCGSCCESFSFPVSDCNHLCNLKNLRQWTTSHSIHTLGGKKG